VRIALYGKPTADQRSVTWHMRLHSVTCYRGPAADSGGPKFPVQSETCTVLLCL